MTCEYNLINTINQDLINNFTNNNYNVINKIATQDFTFKINSVPHTGNISVSPSSGFGLNTTFTLELKSWKDDFTTNLD